MKLIEILEEMSDGDITRLNRMYRCKKYMEEEDYDIHGDGIKIEDVERRRRISDDPEVISNDDIEEIQDATEKSLPKRRSQTITQTKSTPDNGKMLSLLKDIVQGLVDAFNPMIKLKQTFANILINIKNM